MSDVAIIGAGPAGSSLALRLARAGFDVTLVERSRFPRTKVCGDYLCMGAIDSLTELGIAHEVLAGAQPIRSIALHGFGADLQLRLPGKGALSLRRALLDERMLAAARDAGASLLHGVFLRAEEEGRLVGVVYRDERGAERRLTARMLIGADGARSTVAQRTGMAPLASWTGRWAVGGQLLESCYGDELEMHVGAQGYYARNPLGDGSANSMLVLPKPAQLEEADSIVMRITCGKRSFERSKIERPVAIGPLRYRAARVARNRILLTGDAAELLDPFTGQGVATALALSVPACAAASALLRGEAEERVAARYATQWRSIVAPRRALGRLISAIIRVRFLRDTALRSIRRDMRSAHDMLASVSGVAPARRALAPDALWRLLAS